MNLNRAMVIGNLTRDPETRTTTGGKSVCTFSVATNSTWKDAAGQKQERSEFHNVVAWAKLAEICQQFLGKGRKVYIEGRLQTREWDGPDGQKRSRTEIVAENMIMLDRSPQGGGQSAGAGASWSQNQAPAPEAAGFPQQQQHKEEEIKVEDIPF